jgi:hypothetical protein
MRAIVYTIVTSNCLFQARTLMESVAKHWPDAGRRVVIVDGSDEVGANSEGFEVIAGDRLGLPRFRHHAFLLDGVSLCCLLKPLAALHLLESEGPDALVYLDGDTCLYARPDALLEALEQFPIVLTPHVLAPLPPGQIRDDFNLLRSGAFNAGCFALRAGPVARRFLGWWGGNLDQPGHVSPAWSYDQAWLNLTPLFFPELGILRDPGYNVAYWNLYERPLTADETGTVRVAGLHPLVLFHFSFFRADRPDVFAYRGNVHLRIETEPLRSLARAYAERLSAHGRQTLQAQPYRYDRFTDGTPVTALHRAYYAARAAGATDRDGDPFDPAFAPPGCRGLKAVYRANHWLVRSLRWFRLLGRTLLHPETRS